MDHEEFDHWDHERKRRRAERDGRRGDQRQVDSEEGDGPGRGDPRGARKAKVLHTRISKQLDESLRSAADEMRVPVSNLVRNVLEDVFDVVETVTENVEDLVGDLVGEAEHVRERFARQRSARSERRRRPDAPERPTAPEPQQAPEGAESAEATAEPDRERAEFPDVIGWQPMVLNREQRCADCGRDLIRGDQGFMGVGGADAWLCRECVAAR